jgi:hypothetical protein
LPVIGPQLWTSSFLPAVYQGTYLANGDSDPEKLIRHLRNHEIGLEEQRRQLDLLGKLNSMGLEREGSDPELEASIESMEIAYRMQSQRWTRSTFARRARPLKRATALEISRAAASWPGGWWSVASAWCRCISATASPGTIMTTS